MDGGTVGDIGRRRRQVACSSDLVDRHDRAVVAGQRGSAELVRREHSLNAGRRALANATRDGDRVFLRAGVVGGRLDSDRPGALLDLIVGSLIDGRRAPVVDDAVELRVGGQEDRLDVVSVVDVRPTRTGALAPGAVAVRRACGVGRRAARNRRDAARGVGRAAVFRQAPWTGVHDAGDGIGRPGHAGVAALFKEIDRVPTDDTVVVEVVGEEVAEVLQSGRRRELEIEVAGVDVVGRRVDPRDDGRERLRVVADVERVSARGARGEIQAQRGHAVDEAGRRGASVADDQSGDGLRRRLQREDVRQLDASEPLLAVAAELPGEIAREAEEIRDRSELGRRRLLSLERARLVHPVGRGDQERLEEGSRDRGHPVSSVEGIGVRSVGVEALVEIVANEKPGTRCGCRGETRRDLARDNVAADRLEIVVPVGAAVIFGREPLAAGVGAGGHEQGGDPLAIGARGTDARIRPASLDQVLVAQIVRVARSADANDVLRLCRRADGGKIGDPVSILVSSGIARGDEDHGVAVLDQERIDLVCVGVGRGWVDASPREVRDASALQVAIREGTGAGGGARVQRGAGIQDRVCGTEGTRNLSHVVATTGEGRHLRIVGDQPCLGGDAVETPLDARAVGGVPGVSARIVGRQVHARGVAERNHGHRMTVRHAARRRAVAAEKVAASAEGVRRAVKGDLAVAGDHVRGEAGIESGRGLGVREVARIDLDAVVDDHQDLIVVLVGRAVGGEGLLEAAAVNAGVGVRRRAVPPLAGLHDGRGFFREHVERHDLLDHENRVESRNVGELAAIEVDDERVPERTGDPSPDRGELAVEGFGLLSGEQLQLQRVNVGNRPRRVGQGKLADRGGQLERRLIRHQGDDRAGIISDGVFRALGHLDVERADRNFRDDRAAVPADRALDLVERAVREGGGVDLEQEIL